MSRAMPERAAHRSRAGLLATAVTALVLVTGGSTGEADVIVGFLNCWAYVWIVPRVFERLAGRGDGPARASSSEPISSRELAAALTILPGLADAIGARPSIAWHAAYLVLAFTGWGILAMTTPYR